MSMWRGGDRDREPAESQASGLGSAPSLSGVPAPVKTCELASDLSWHPNQRGLQLMGKHREMVQVDGQR